MDSPLSAAKVILLAVNFAAYANIDSLGTLANRYSHLLQRQLLLRILLSYLPETTNPTEYISLLKHIGDGNGSNFAPLVQGEIDCTSIEQLTDNTAEKKVKKLQLRQLYDANSDISGDDDDLVIFLKQRAYRIDSQAGLLSLIPSLVEPFIDKSPSFYLWVTTTVQPFVKRYSTYYADDHDRILLEDFERLSDGAALGLLLGKTAPAEHATRDLFNLVLPWISSKERWTGLDCSIISQNGLECSAWRHYLELMLTWNLGSWSTTTKLVQQWNRSRSLEVPRALSSSLNEAQYAYLDNTWDQAVIACIYNISDTTTEAIHGAYSMCRTLLQSRDNPSPQELELYLSSSDTLAPADVGLLGDAKLISFLRSFLLDSKNPLTAPTAQSLSLLMNLIGSTYICNKFGLGVTIRRVADLVLLQDLREQKTILSRLIRGLCAQALRDQDTNLLQARASFLWLRHWNVMPGSDVSGPGLLGAVSVAEIESEVLKALLEQSSTYKS